ncbi:MAG: glycosyltransferase [Gaiellaceae bacterium]
MLSGLGDVTVLTSDVHREAAMACPRGAGAGAFPEGVELRFVEEPSCELASTEYRRAHEWSARVREALRDLCSERQVDLIEFPDWGGEGCVTLQARRTQHDVLRRTQVCVRAHSTVEMNAALNGYLPCDIESVRLFDLERFSLRYADTVLWAGGDILFSYERFYGKNAIGPAGRIRHPAPAGIADAGGVESARGDGRLRLLYLGRLERRKGIERLIRAMREVESDQLELMIVGADTSTGPLGVSMRELLALQAAGDERIVFGETRSRPEVVELVRTHDAGVLPSVWECWPNVVLEFFGLNRPVLGTPTGGPLEMVEDGRSGWLTNDASVAAIARGLDKLAAAPQTVDRITGSRAPRRRFAELTSESPILDGYRALLESAARPRRPTSRSPGLVSVVVTYFALAEHVEETVASLAAQTYEPLELIVVNDGSFEPDDVVLDRLVEAPYRATVVTQENSGAAAARNFGIRQSQGRYFLPFDADNVLDPSFVSRCAEVLDSDPSIAYATSWERVVDEHNKPAFPVDWQWHYRFVSNFCASVVRENIAGDAPALLRRSLFDQGFAYETTLSGYEDWHLYQRLAAAGHYGHAIPEPLISYRVRSDSILRRVALPHDERLRGEMTAADVGGANGWATP